MLDHEHEEQLLSTKAQVPAVLHEILPYHPSCYVQGADASMANGSSALTPAAGTAQRSEAELESMGLEQPAAAATASMTSPVLRQQVRLLWQCSNA